MRRPEGVVKEIPAFALIEAPIEHGYLACGASRIKLDFCRFRMQWRKRSYFWTNIPKMIEECSGAHHTRLCSADNPCPNYWAGTHMRLTRDVRTANATAFPTALCSFIADNMEATCAHKRMQR